MDRRDDEPPFDLSEDASDNARIAQATGMLMQQHGLDAHTAHALLKTEEVAPRGTPGLRRELTIARSHVPTQGTHQSHPRLKQVTDGMVLPTNHFTGGIAMNRRPQLDLPAPAHVTEGAANARLSVFALVVLIANVLLAALAVAVNWPSQFGGVVGTNAGQDWLSRGTAISAPLAPAVCFVLIALLVRFSNWAGWLGIGLAFLTGVLVFVGGLGELVAEPTDDVPRAVLITAGVLWGVIAAIFGIMAISATRERLAHHDAT